MRKLSKLLSGFVMLASFVLVQSGVTTAKVNKSNNLSTDKSVFDIENCIIDSKPEELSLRLNFADNGLGQGLAQALIIDVVPPVPFIQAFQSGTNIPIKEGQLTNKSAIDIVVQFYKTSPLPAPVDTVIGFDPNNQLVVSNANIINVVENIQGSRWTVTIEPTKTSTMVSVYVPEAVCTDKANNSNTKTITEQDNAVLRFAYDGQKPVPSITTKYGTTNDTIVNGALQLNLALSFSKSVLEGTSAPQVAVLDPDQLVNNISLTPVDYDPVNGTDSYWVNLDVIDIANTDGVIKVFFAEDQVQDLTDPVNGNFNQLSDTFYIYYDNIKPTIVANSLKVAPNEVKQGAIFKVEFEASESLKANPVISFAGSVADMQSVLRTGNKYVYEFKVTSSRATIQPDLQIGELVDMAGNTTASQVEMYKLTIDNEAPSLYETQTKTMVSNAELPIAVALYFDQPIANFNLGNIEIGNGYFTNYKVGLDSVGLFINPIDPFDDALITLKLLDGVVTDPSGNPYEMNSADTVMVAYVGDSILSEISLHKMEGTFEKIDAGLSIKFNKILLKAAYLKKENGTTAVASIAQVPDPSNFVFNINGVQVSQRIDLSDLTNGVVWYELDLPQAATANSGDLVSVSIAPKSAKTVDGALSLSSNSVSVIYDNQKPVITSASFYLGGAKKSGTISSLESGYKPTTKELTLVVKLSEAVSGFDHADLQLLDISNATIIGFDSISAIEYAYVLQPDYSLNTSNSFDVIVKLDHTISDLKDKAGNALGNFTIDQTLKIDAVRPEVYVYYTGANSGSVFTNNTSPVISIKVSEELKGDLTASNLLVVHHKYIGNQILSLADFTKSGRDEYSFSFSPVNDPSGGRDSITISLVNYDTLTISDLNGNLVKPFSSTLYYDSRGPVPVFKSLSKRTNQDTIKVSLTFDEKVIGFDVSELAIEPRTAMAVLDYISGDSIGLKVVVANEFAGDVRLGLVNNTQITDLAGNKAVNTEPIILMVDRIQPDVVFSSGNVNFNEEFQAGLISDSVSTYTGRKQVEITASFSEAVSGVTANAFGVVNGVVLQVNKIAPDLYKLLVEANTADTVSLMISKMYIRDLAGNALNRILLNGQTNSSVEDVISYKYDPILGNPYVVALESSDVVKGATTNRSSVSFRIEFSEEVFGLTPANFSQFVTNAQVRSIKKFGKSFLFDVVPTSLGDTILISLGANIVWEKLGFKNNALSSDLAYSYIYDGSQPYVSSVTSSIVGDGESTNQKRIPITVRFNEPIQSFTKEMFERLIAITIDGQIVNSGYSNVSYFDSPASTFSFTLQLPESVSDHIFDYAIAVKSGDVVSDVAGNRNSMIGDTLNFVLDLGAPSSRFVTSELVNSPNQSSLLTKHKTVTFSLEFSEPVSGLANNDFVVRNGIITGLSKTGNLEYEVTLSANSPGIVELSLQAAAVIDDAGNTNTVSEVNYVYTPDSIGPKVILSSVDVWNGGYTRSQLVKIDLQVADQNYFDTPITETIMVSNGTQSGPVKNGEIYTYFVSPTSNGEVTIKVPEGTVQDLFLTGNKEVVFTYYYDDETPLVSFDKSGTVELGVDLTINASEAGRLFLIANAGSITDTASLYRSAKDARSVVLSVDPGNTLISTTILTSGVSYQAFLVDRAGNIGVSSSVSVSLDTPKLIDAPSSVCADGVYEFQFSPAIGQLSLTPQLGTSSAISRVSTEGGVATYLLDVSALPINIDDYVVSYSNNMGAATSVLHIVRPPVVDFDYHNIGTTLRLSDLIQTTESLSLDWTISRDGITILNYQGVNPGLINVSDLVSASQGPYGIYTVSLNISMVSCPQLSASGEKSITISTVGNRDISMSKIGIYPNPTVDGIVSIVGEFVGNEVVRMYNASGALVFVGKLQGDKITQLDLSLLNSGVYNIVINTDAGVVTDHVLINR